MKIKIILTILFIIFGFFLIKETKAAPSITSFSGNAVNASSVTISGSEFSVKTSVSPYVWDSFETGTNNTTIHNQFPTVPSDNRAWSGNWVSGCEPVYSDAQNRSGSSLSAKLDLNVGETCSGRTLAQHGIPLNAGDKIYFSVWMRFDWGVAGGNGNRQIKTWRIFKSGIPEFDRTYIYVSNLVENDGTTSKSFLATLNDGDTDFNENFDFALEDKKWVRFEGEFQISSAPNTADGVGRLWVSRADFSDIINKEIDRSNVIFIPANGDIWDSFWLGQWIGNATAPYSTTLYYDDVYFDTSWQRVEIGDNATWAACTHREIQTPTAWTDTSITINVNQGSFEACGTYYLFVVDADGNVNAEGYPIKVVTGSGAAPCPPTGLHIVP